MAEYEVILQVIFNYAPVVLTMTEPDDAVHIEVNAPPSIEINPESIPANQPIMLSGGVQQISQQGMVDANPQNVKFVMGPDGQIIAIEKPPFTWKHFAIGGGIPFALYFIPLLLLMILNPGYDYYSTEPVTLTLEEGTTTYSGDFQTPSGYEFEYCWFDNMNDDEGQFECQPTSEDSAIIEYRSYDNSITEEIGWWNNSNGVIMFDNGTDFGESITMQFEYWDSDSDFEIYHVVEEIIGLTCCLGLLLSIVMLIVGFSTGKPGMGYGGVLALVAAPVVGITTLSFLW
jgi:hypothetical protein